MSTISRLFLGLLLVSTLLCSVPGGDVHAAEPRVTRVEPAVRNGKLEIDADIEFELNQQLRDAAQRGVPLYFTADLTMTQQRWYWFDKSLVDTSRTWRVVYNALTRQWRAGVGELSFPVASLDDAMSVIRHIRNWSVADAADFDAGVLYGGQLRLRLDTSLLPRPFQVNALNSSSWAQGTPWTEFSFMLSDQEKDPS
ncbi:DUF4390 domain-containing protein [Achromobacter sp. LC458]|uniref:DUF4390 domain-containing protein n=2 Tax=Alcaligenaceae TaxID=506 RepID=A0A2S5GXF4_9BURK|nr:DUF4390 domain-containing protein [Achromobacter sp. B7]PPA77513.1 DUF4390 domain-containing protein [Achromobacter spanius]TRM54192.1 DUF4390 domain-containing protein [Achromobacter sp. LC458]HCQ46591.1 DUF4390 domain-containing protein [Achromobacter sp.]